MRGSVVVVAAAASIESSSLTRSLKLRTPFDASAGDAVLLDSCEYLSL